MVHDAINSPESKLIGGAIQENKDKASAANPITYINSKTPPFLIIHGMIDLTVPYCQSKVLKIALESAKIQSELIPVRNGGHGKNVFKEEFQNKMVMFFKMELNKYTINE
jgi:dipeptidyl aminopeptidase/acylaminoacyl peptidase